MSSGCLTLVVLALLHLAQCVDEFQDNKLDGLVDGVLELQPSLYEPAWVYKCSPEEGCNRSQHPLGLDLKQPNSTTYYESLIVCQTVCGRFGGIWPRPRTATLSNKMIRIHPNSLRFDLYDVPSRTRPSLVKMTQLATQNLVAECWGNVTEFSSTPVVVFISVKTPELELTWETNEEYMLDVQTKEDAVTVNIVAETIFGARHALETFTHLVAPEKPEFTEKIKCSLLLIAAAKIRDKPAYKHRGFLLDTSRNFIPIEDIQRMINGLAAAKMNVFHWHVTDTQSFPLESLRVPQFTRYGAYSTLEIYTKEEVTSLIEYAKIRGVRVIIEIDSPAHAGNGWQWGQEYGFGDLAVCVNAKPWRHFCIQPPCGQLNPANPYMYSVLRDLYRDLLEVLPSPPLLHVGGDEVFFSCWNSSAEIRSYMKDKGFDTASAEGFYDLWSEFHRKALEIWDQEIAAKGIKDQQQVMIWSSGLTNPEKIKKYLDKERYIIEVWEPVHSLMLTQLLHRGYHVIAVPKDVWYLDHGFWGSTTYANWRKMYNHQLPDDSLVLGGEVAMWTEYVDVNALDGRVWPRVAAVAERLWTNPSPLANVNAAEPRLQRMRERLISRGIRPDVLSPTWCAQNANRCV